MFVVTSAMGGFAFSDGGCSVEPDAGAVSGIYDTFGTTKPGLAPVEEKPEPIDVAAFEILESRWTLICCEKSRPKLEWRVKMCSRRGHFPH
ncbi:hypothetical protein JG688_00006068 [Phytophthora aleatoria]|uniref:Uncharacterized protein n=1 Tax=Phytophthora aleatoria TaxID=2496075 RepID=A0A8J5J1E5_9STRA|nr:hypothetical protein JG688_00006068 [Phytophthora aleatoria]